MTLVELEGLTCGYQDRVVLSGLDLRLEEGQRLGLAGHTGSGKTTLLKTVMGIVRARAGRIRFDGVDVTALDTHVIARRGITLVPEERRIFPRLTVDENLRVATLASRAGDATRARVFEYFPRLRERLGHAGQDLSGGEQQMLALARGFLARPQLMLIDELSGGLMPLLVDALMDILQRINAEGITILLVEQDLEVALALARRCYVLDQGRIEYSGTAQSLRDNRDVQQRYLGVA
jgi:branched-chain amino acid transport system ATP-binding protein